MAYGVTTTTLSLSLHVILFAFLSHDVLLCVFVYLTLLSKGYSQGCYEYFNVSFEKTVQPRKLN